LNQESGTSLWEHAWFVEENTEKLRKKKYRESSDLKRKRSKPWWALEIDWRAWEDFGRNWLKINTREVDWRAARWEIDFKIGFRVMKEGDEILGSWEQHTREILGEKRGRWNFPN